MSHLLLPSQVREQEARWKAKQLELQPPLHPGCWFNLPRQFTSKHTFLAKPLMPCTILDNGDTNTGSNSLLSQTVVSEARRAVQLQPGCCFLAKIFQEVWAGGVGAASSSVAEVGR